MLHFLFFVLGPPFSLCLGRVHLNSSNRRQRMLEPKEHRPVSKVAEMYISVFQQFIFAFSTFFIQVDDLGVTSIYVCYRGVACCGGVAYVC